MSKSVYILKAHQSTKIVHSFKIFVIIKTQRFTCRTKSCFYNLPLFDDDKTMYFNDTILKSLTIDIQVSQEIYQNLGLEKLILLYNAPSESETWSRFRA